LTGGTPDATMLQAAFGGRRMRHCGAEEVFGEVELKRERAKESGARRVRGAEVRRHSRRGGQPRRSGRACGRAAAASASGSRTAAASARSAAGISWICGRLERRYGSPRPRGGGSPLAVLVRTILSQNTTDANRDAAYSRLVRKFPTWRALAAARTDEIARAIRPAGLYESKSRAIRGLLRYLDARFGSLDGAFLCRMKSSEALRELTAIKGIGVKTVSVALMFGCGRDDVFPVDTHVLRVSKRLGLVPEKATAEKAHRILGASVPRGRGAALHLNMIRLGREVCRPRRPSCGDCVLERRCPHAAGDGAEGRGGKM